MFMCVGVYVCLSVAFISRVHINVNNYYFCIALSRVCESGGAVLADFVGLWPRVANEEVYVA